jgi:PiT family inorganic phosphate transporter
LRTIGRGIVRLQPLDGVAGQGASAGVLIAASALGAPVSTTQVVASGVIGAGGGRGRWRHIHWRVVRAIGLGWVLTLPVCAAGAAAITAVWTSAA